MRIRKGAAAAVMGGALLVGRAIQVAVERSRSADDADAGPRTETRWRWRCACGAHSRTTEHNEVLAKFLADRHRLRNVGHEPEVYSTEEEVE
jgi:hypothetical protein